MNAFWPFRLPSASYAAREQVQGGIRLNPDDAAHLLEGLVGQVDGDIGLGLRRTFVDDTVLPTRRELDARGDE